MEEEVKKVSLSWSEKGVPDYDISFTYDTLLCIDKALVECNEILGEAGLGTGYESRQTTILKLEEDHYTLNRYIGCLPQYVYDTLDQPLYEAFNRGATESISRIRLEDFEVTNTLGLTEDCYVPGMQDLPGEIVTRKKATLGFADFLGTSVGEKEVSPAGTVIHTGCVKGFADIFAAQYESMKSAGMLGTENVPTLDEYLTQFSEQGEFDNRMDKPFLSFVSAVLDITIVKPIIEACTGEDMITGEDLSDMERGLKVVFAVIDLATLGQAMAATKLAGLGGKEAVKVLGKTALVEFTSNAVAEGVGTLGQELGLPVSITLLLSMGGGLTVSTEGTKLLFKNANDDLIRQVELEGRQLEDIRTALDDVENLSLNGKPAGIADIEVPEIPEGVADAAVAGKYLETAGIIPDGLSLIHI